MLAVDFVNTCGNGRKIAVFDKLNACVQVGDISAIFDIKLSGGGDQGKS
jgi:hypothetical protein